MTAPTVPYASPWSSPSHLEAFALPETANRAATRDQAMRVPAVARARQLIVANIARCPLTVTTGATPAWITADDGPYSPFHRMLWTCDDLFFHGWSAWATRRDNTGAVLAADRIPFAHWTIDPDGTVRYLGSPVADTDVIVVPGVSEGLLSYGADTIAHAVDLAAAARSSARTPALNTIIRQTSGEPLSPDMRRQVVDDFVTARRTNGHGVSFASANVDVIETGRRDPGLLLDGRNAAVIDVARVTGVPAAMLDADAGTSMTYQNTAARMAELIDFALAPYMAAIAGRLSQADVLPSQTAEFDTSVLTGVADTAPDPNPSTSTPTTLRSA